MFSRGNTKFYIEEVSLLKDGRLVIPHNWIIRKGKLSSDCSVVTPNDVTLGLYYSYTGNLININADRWMDNQQIHFEYLCRYIRAKLFRCARTHWRTHKMGR